MNKKIIGFVSAVFAAVIFGLNPLFALKLFPYGISSATVLFYRFFVAALLIGICILCQRISFRIPKKALGMVFCLALCLAGTSLGLFASFEEIDSSIASTLLFIYPIMVAVIMTVFFREKVTLAGVGSIVMSLAGVLLLCKSPSGNVNFTGVALAIFSALAYAVYIVLVKKSVLRELSPLVMTFYTMLFALPFFAAVPSFEPVVPLNAEVILNIVGLAFFPGFLSLYLTALGLKYIGATQCAILGALEPLTAVCIGIMVYKESFSFNLAAGIVLIIAAVSFVILSDRKRETV